MHYEPKYFAISPYYYYYFQTKESPPPSSLKVCVKLSVCVIILDKTVKVFSQTQELIIIEQVGLQGLLQYRV